MYLHLLVLSRTKVLEEISEDLLFWGIPAKNVRGMVSLIYIFLNPCECVKMSFFRPKKNFDRKDHMHDPWDAHILEFRENCVSALGNRWISSF